MNIFLLRQSKSEKILVKCHSCSCSSDSYMSHRGAEYILETDLKKEGKCIKCPHCDSLLGYVADLKRPLKNNIQTIHLISEIKLESLEINARGSGCGWN